jgi:hypothetical protein
MADLSDVEAAFVTAIAATLFPSGYTPGAFTLSTVAGCTLQICRGWPIANVTDPALLAGQAIVSVWPQPNASRDTTRYGRLPQTQTIYPITFTATLSATATQVTFAGTCSVNQVVGVTTGGVGYAYRMLANDTPATAAAALAALIPGSVASGATLSLISPYFFTFAAVVSDTTQITEIGRQCQVFHVIVWAPTPAIRDTLCSLIQPAMAEARNLSLPDQTTTDIIKYRGSTSDDVVQKANLWKRTLRYETEYPTTQVATSTGMLFATVDVLTQGGGVFSFGTLQPGNYVIMDNFGNLLVGGTSLLSSLDGLTNTVTGPFYDQNGTLVTTGPNFLHA